VPEFWTFGDRNFMTKKPASFWAAISAVVIESVVCVMVHRYGHIGGDGPDFWGAIGLATELPGAVVGESLFGVTSPMVVVLGAVSGAMEWFAVFWVGITACRKMFGGINAEPSDEPNGASPRRLS
jgi:hypothetical protein